MISLVNYYPIITIIGAGVVGKATGYIFHGSAAVSYLDLDSTESHIDSRLISPDYIFICVPTPTVKGKQDISAIEQWLKIIAKTALDKPIIIRSTVLPGTCEKLTAKYKLNIVHIPEFLSENSALDDAKNPQFLVVGGNDILLRREVRDFFSKYVVTDNIIECDLTTAEVIKYTMNSFFALKVIFANEIYDLCESVDASYSKVVEVIEGHKWGSKNGWDVFRGGFRGYGGKCLPKDIEALINAHKMSLMEKVAELNEKLNT
jgi:UDPglucose 6-dehydrogenase